MHSSIQAALEAHRRGYTPVAVSAGSKRPVGLGWTQSRYDTEEQVRATFEQHVEQGATNLGLVLGEASGRLLDVDIDHPKAMRLRKHFLPDTGMRTGRTGRMGSHYWYVVDTHMPTATRQYKMPDRSVAVELRTNGSQTVIPPSVHESGETYLWEGEPWGTPARVDGRKLSARVALLGMTSVLLEAWPKQGSRHDAYLALAGGLLRYRGGVHPFWQQSLHNLIGPLALVSGDEEGPETRIAEVMGTTIRRLNEGDDSRAVGWPRLAELIGNDHAEMARRIAKDVQTLAGWVGEALPDDPTEVLLEVDGDSDAVPSSLPLPDAERNPLEERQSSWESVDLGPYLSGDLGLPEPSILEREDGQCLIYPGRVNSLFGKSESAKSWIAMLAGVQQISKGERVLYIDLEDDPTGIIERFRLLGAATEDLRHLLRYVRPETPNADMQRNRWGGSSASDEGEAGREAFMELLAQFDPTLIIVDGMTALYGLHGLDTNDASNTDVVTTWLKKTCRTGRSTVVVIDHTGKSGGAGSSPIGAHHKMAMVQGISLRVDVVDRPIPGELGNVQLVVFKDRLGTVRRLSKKAKTGDGEQLAGDVWIDSRSDDRTLITIKPPQQPDPDRPIIGDTDGAMNALERINEQEQLRDDIVALFGGDLDLKLTTAEVVVRLGLSDGEETRVRSAWRVLRQSGVVEKNGSTRNVHYMLKMPVASSQEVCDNGDTNEDGNNKGGRA